MRNLQSRNSFQSWKRHIISSNLNINILKFTDLWYTTYLMQESPYFSTKCHWGTIFDREHAVLRMTLLLSITHFYSGNIYFKHDVRFMLWKGHFQKISSQTCAGRMLSFPPEVVLIGWTLIQERNFFGRPASTLTTRPKVAVGKFALHKMPLFWSHLGSGLTVRVEAGRAKIFLSWINVHSMGTYSGENESILPAHVWELFF